jgi:Flp pilus assembly protein protease CpaA
LEVTAVIFSREKYYFNIPVTIILFIVFMYLAFQKSGLQPSVMVVTGLLCLILLLISQSDIKGNLIPNLYIVLLFAPIIIEIIFVGSVSITERFIGFLLIAIPLTIVKMIKPNGIGGGDIKLLALSGLLLGSHVIAALLIGSILAGAVNIILLAIGKVKRNQRCWVGPYYALGIWYCYVYVLR